MRRSSVRFREWAIFWRAGRGGFPLFFPSLIFLRCLFTNPFSPFLRNLCVITVSVMVNYSLTFFVYIYIYISSCVLPYTSRLASCPFPLTRKALHNVNNLFLGPSNPMPVDRSACYEHCSMWSRVVRFSSRFRSLSLYYQCARRGTKDPITDQPTAHFPAHYVAHLLPLASMPVGMTRQEALIRQCCLKYWEMKLWI